LGLQGLRAPARPASKPDHCAVVYVFAAPAEVLKVGMAGPKSAPRVVSHHYGVNRNGRTLARSLAGAMHDGRWPYPPLPGHLSGPWIERNCQLVHLLLDADQVGRNQVLAIEALLRLRLRPRFEGRRK